MLYISDLKFPKHGLALCFLGQINSPSGVSVQEP